MVFTLFTCCDLIVVVVCTLALNVKATNILSVYHFVKCCLKKTKREGLGLISFASISSGYSSDYRDTRKVLQSAV